MLLGVESIPSLPLSTEGQAHRLIAEATDHEKLGQVSCPDSPLVQVQAGLPSASLRWGPAGSCVVAARDRARSPFKALAPLCRCFGDGRPATESASPILVILI